eukprot:5767818-Heterocapsa_arctica.AAC.1
MDSNAVAPGAGVYLAPPAHQGPRQRPPPFVSGFLQVRQIGQMLTSTLRFGNNQEDTNQAAEDRHFATQTELRERMAK